MGAIIWIILSYFVGVGAGYYIGRHDNWFED